LQTTRDEWLDFLASASFAPMQKGAPKFRRLLAWVTQVFSESAVQEEIGPENRNSHPYELNGLMNRHFRFPTDPADGIEEIRVRKLRFAVKGHSRRRLTLEADADGKVDDVYDMLERYINQKNLPTSILNVTQVGLTFRFDNSNEELPRSLSFELSFPNSSNLRSKPDVVRELAQKYLRQWGLDRAANTGVDHADSSSRTSGPHGRRPGKS
jgi:hypothetical protein